MTEPPKKKRKLPSLADDFLAPARPTDSPELHQGRKRTVPHQRGQWASHVYLELSPSDELRRTLKKALKLVSAEKSAEVLIHSLLPGDTSKADSQDTEGLLHLSLSRPLILQTNQRSELRAGLASLAGKTKSFSARYATFAWLENDEKTRRFLGIEIGVGYSEMNAFTSLLNAELAKLRQPAYYDSPRFHTSIAWTSTTSSTVSSASQLPFDDAQLARLEEQLGKDLRDEEMWVGKVCVKIGKEVTRYVLGGT